ncbi:hypothetical protein AMAG_14220 [Allomyces macrogynus ATCC 38327]|uniref:Ketoreductase domain-containing protein n=1 Tax=Allomyces macrogynus (strain ATCC 38327) TaxID=578462 RepID=A0A0L0T4K5_ALLM3|nr:hypothetical protein AMAG_14220 [Allomyces macrogynus ATCC 38327]|eukprot:KNE69665.1 hypothetical protein AMAG_14220 [Allomyces macrogynus ATCC 38327]
MGRLAGQTVFMYARRPRLPTTTRARKFRDFTPFLSGGRHGDANDSTGASAGIGASCARHFAAEHCNLVLTARRLERLEELRAELLAQYPDIQVYVVALDVTKRADVFAVVDALPEAFKNVDVLVNNAGLSLGLDHLLDVSEESVNIMFDTNVKGLLNVTQAIVPAMKQRGKGHIINIGSVAGKQAYAGGSIYCATKHAVEAMSQALTQELVNTPLRVTLVAPGLVQTEFSVVRFHGNQDKADSVYKGLDPLTGDDIAEVVVFAASRPPHVQINDILVYPTQQASVFHVHRN